MKNKTYITISLIILLVCGFSAYEFFRTDKSSSSNRSISVIDTIENKPVKIDLLGKAEISYAGGTEGRGKNIELGIGRINGRVVAPGEEFSFTKTLGSVTAEDGFSEEKIFLNGDVTKGVGGGLCQVSTALFQSVVRAGLSVTERQNHTFTVSRYDVGLDATYSDPGPDLKFVNDMAYPVTIKGKVENQKAIFEIYGVADGRQASTTEPEITDVVDYPPTKYVATSTRDKSEPECINTPQIGYTAKVVYGILYASGTTTEQVFTSTYKPLQRICYIDIVQNAK